MVPQPWPQFANEPFDSPKIPIFIHAGEGFRTDAFAMAKALKPFMENPDPSRSNQIYE
jgi:hypothetical protein